MTGDGYRIERDSMGEVKVPAKAYYGAQTQRAVENFPVSGLRFPPSFIRAMGMIKLCSARANLDLGLLDRTIAETIIHAAQEVVEGKWDGEFVLDIFQTGSGTSTNMNTNEVIANRAIELLGGQIGSKSPVHPNDHVNLGQSSNDVIPTAIHLAALQVVDGGLLPALRRLHQVLLDKAAAFDRVVKIGRTHLQDATPVRLGQEFSGYARQIELAIARVERIRPSLAELALGGTAVGTGINTHPDFPDRAIRYLAEMTQLPLTEAKNHFAAQASLDAVVETSGALKTVAVSLMKIANDIRWLGSGPRCGIGELLLPAIQPGSSIMPGKVNPVIPEAVIQVAAQVIGNDACITIGGQGGYFELNVMMPITAYALLQSIAHLGSVCRIFVDHCLMGIRADETRCAELIEQSLAMCTALAPVIGYDAAAKIANESYATGKTIRQVALEQRILPEEELKRILDPWRMTERGF
ncbi:MAG: class II fumarate hydratase [candidate division NC10 bacterium]|nr:class II fumarate hydratase [candidate division NC10 bacterium]